MRRHRKTGAALTVALALIAAAVLAAGGPDAASEREAVPSPPPAVEDAGIASEDAIPGRSATRVYLDPDTGRMRPRPVDPEARARSQAMRDRLSTYGEDLIQEALPEGGFKVDLRGRFQSAVVATIDPQTDEVTVDCVRTPASDEAGDER